MKPSCTTILLTLLATLSLQVGVTLADYPQPPAFAGSDSCRECHEKFHTLWNTSRHRNTIIPYSDDFAKKELLPQKEPITIGKFSYLANISPGKGVVVETGPGGTKTYKIERVLGGKGIYAFLTTLEDGRIESFPIGYDIKKKEWYEAENAVDAPAPDGGKKFIPYWKNYPFFFSEACPSCHVSGFAIKHDPATKKYTETWSEPGINCETCHGPAAEHNAAMRKVPKGQPVADPKLISVKKMSPHRRSDLCVTCHAKQTALTNKFTPGDRYFDHYELTILDNNEFYPDGRDQGEDYTLTSWSMNKCVKDGKPDCIHCHTSSGRYRFKDAAKANDACLPCHAERVKNVASHSHHKGDGPGSRCISCHMPKTSYARMTRSDHSLRPPMPAATLEFGSPNACNVCHQEKDAAWADQVVRKWHPGDYQAETLRTGRLIAAARKREWAKLPEMLAYLEDKKRSEIFAASLVKMLRWCRDERVAPVLRRELQDPSPLVRAAAAEALGSKPSTENAAALVTAAGDDYRLVRVKAAASLAYFPRKFHPKEAEKGIGNAHEEYRASLLMEPDRWSTWLTVGSNHIKREEFEEAVSALQTALTINPKAITAILNLSYAQSRLGQVDEATRTLSEAIRIEPDNVMTARMAANTAFGQAALTQAEAFFTAAIEKDPKSASAAYGLCAITPQGRLAEAVEWCRKAVESDPNNARHRTTLMRKLEQKDEAATSAVMVQGSTTQPDQRH